MQKVGVGVHCSYMEGESTNQMENLGTQMYTDQYSDIQPLPEFSFIPDELMQKEEATPHNMRERCALIGAILGAIAVISWIVIIFGLLYSILGITLSFVGLKSNRQKYAQLGLGLSLLGLFFTFTYAFAAYNGMINYNYFTTEFWVR